MLSPKSVLAMAAYLNSSEALADATEDLIKANSMYRAGHITSAKQFEDVAKIRLDVYRQARANWENLRP